MAQPVRKKIQDTHPEMIKQEDIRTIIVDGGSLLFRCMADTTRNSDGTHVGGIFQFLLQLKMMVDKVNPDYVYVFFDNEYSGLLRYQLYEPYKANRDKHYQSYGASEYAKQYNENLKRMQSYIYGKNKKEKPVGDYQKLVDENFDRERDSLMKYFEELYIRCYMDEVVEGDDLIAYYCINKKPNEKIYIMSGDVDLTQLLADDIAIYELNKKKFITKDNFKDYFGYHYENTLVKKIFCGDNSDNIGNIKGLSDVGFANLMPEFRTKKVTVENVLERTKELITERLNAKKKPLKVYENIINGISNKPYSGDFYEINQKIIDLKHPLLTDEAKKVMDSMMYAPQDPNGRSFGNLYGYILEDGITDLMSNTRFASFFSPFKRLEEKEISRFKESLKQ